MIKIDIEKELNSERKVTESSGLLPKTEERLLLAAGTRENNLLKKIGIGRDIIKAEESRGLKIERASLENQFKTQAYTIEEIRSLAIDYDLKFLSTKSFRGSIDTRISAKLAEFFDGNNLNDMDDTERFYLLAPKKAFNFSNKENPKPINPILFYRPNRGDNKYLIIHQWGNEFTMFRLLRGLMKRNLFTLFLSGYVIGFLVVNIFMSMMGNYNIRADIATSFLFGFLGLLTARILFVGEAFRTNDLNEENWQRENQNI